MIHIHTDIFSYLGLCVKKIPVDELILHVMNGINRIGIVLVCFSLFPFSFSGIGRKARRDIESRSCCVGQARNVFVGVDDTQ